MLIKIVHRQFLFLQLGLGDIELMEIVEIQSVAKYLHSVQIFVNH